jgi:DNA primase
MAISEDQKEEIRSKIDIADLVSSYGYQLKHSGSDMWCCCPFHNEKTPSFKVDVSRGTYHCFGCGESGDIFSFVMHQEGLSFGDAIKKLADAVGVELKTTVSPTTQKRRKLYDLMSRLAMDFNKMLKVSKGEGADLARKYIESRKIEAEVVDKFLIGYAPAEVEKILAWGSRNGYSKSDLAAAGIIKLSDEEGRKPYFYFANRLVFTIKDKTGNVVAFSGRQLVEDKKSGKYVNSPETLIFKKSHTFFAYDEARRYIVKAPNREAIICEGQIDCIRLHSNGFQTAIAPLGTAFTEEHAQLLHKVADSAILCFDDDGAGHKATIKAAHLLLAEGMPIRVISLPNGADPDSYIMEYGVSEFSELLGTKTQSIVEFQIGIERGKEKCPTDTNAVKRITDAILETISKSKDKVYRNLLLKEASKLLEIEYEVLQEEVSKSAKEFAQVQKENSEQLIMPPQEGKAEEVNCLPSLAEGCLINYMLTNEDNQPLKECIDHLIPKEILYSPMTKNLMEAWLKGSTPESDTINKVVNALSHDEYNTFTEIMGNVEIEKTIEVSHKSMVAYIARQLWHDYLIRKLKENNGSNENNTLLIDNIKKLHNSTMKGMVQLIQSFPLTNKNKVS